MINGRGVGALAGTTPQWIKDIGDLARPEVKAAVPLLVKTAAENVASRSPLQKPVSTGVPATGGVPTSNGSVGPGSPMTDAGAGYFSKVSQWVQENPGTALTMAATVVLLYVKLRK